MAIIAGITRAASERNISVVIQEVSAEPDAAEVTRLLRHSNPHGVFILRWLPDDQTVNLLKDRGLPAVLIHCSKRAYPVPILASIVPDQERIPADIQMLAQQMKADAAKHGDDAKTDKIVFIRMPEESGAVAEGSIRNERIGKITEGLTGYRTVTVEVDDYGFRHAYEAMRRHPDAMGYICLSDELAVAVKQFLCLRYGHDSGPPVVGFDDSEIAQAESVTSFSHSIDELGKLAVDTLADWFSTREEGDVEWPEFREIKTDVSLTIRP